MLKDVTQNEVSLNINVNFENIQCFIIYLEAQLNIFPVTQRNL